MSILWSSFQVNQERKNPFQSSCQTLLEPAPKTSELSRPSKSQEKVQILQWFRPTTPMSKGSQWSSKPSTWRQLKIPCASLGNIKLNVGMPVATVSLQKWVWIFWRLLLQSSLVLCFLSIFCAITQFYELKFLDIPSDNFLGWHFSLYFMVNIMTQIFNKTYKFPIKLQSKK